MDTVHPGYWGGHVECSGHSAPWVLRRSLSLSPASSHQSNSATVPMFPPWPRRHTTPTNICPLHGKLWDVCFSFFAPLTLVTYYPTLWLIEEEATWFEEQNCNKTYPICVALLHPPHPFQQTFCMKQWVQENMGHVGEVGDIESGG